MRGAILVVCWLGFILAVFVLLPSLPERVSSWAVWSFLAGIVVGVVMPWLWRRSAAFLTDAS